MVRNLKKDNELKTDTHTITLEIILYLLPLDLCCRGVSAGVSLLVYFVLKVSLDDIIYYNLVSGI